MYQYPILALPLDICENCQDTATVYCAQCCNKYCNVCSALRHKHSSRSGHRLTPLSKQDTNETDTTEITGMEYLKYNLILSHYFQISSIHTFLE